jgi:hypothetical protein
MPSAQAAPASLQRACAALWLATLSLMTAFMHTSAPAHRYLLARRIVRNFETLHAQDCFAPHTRASFEKLARRWQARADRLLPDCPGLSRQPAPESADHPAPPYSPYRW